MPLRFEYRIDGHNSTALALTADMCVRLKGISVCPPLPERPLLVRGVFVLGSFRAVRGCDDFAATTSTDKSDWLDRSSAWRVE